MLALGSDTHTAHSRQTPSLGDGDSQHSGTRSSRRTPSSSGRQGARMMAVLIERCVLVSRAATPDCFSRSVPHLRTDRANNTQMSGRATVVGEEASARAGRPWAVGGRVPDRASHRAHRMRALESMRPRSFFTARTGLLDVCARALCKGTFASTVSGVAFGGEGGREFEAAGAHRRPVRSKGIVREYRGPSPSPRARAGQPRRRDPHR